MAKIAPLKPSKPRGPVSPATVEAGGVNLVELLAPAYEALAQAAERRALEG